MLRARAGHFYQAIAVALLITWSRQAEPGDSSRSWRRLLSSDCDCAAQDMISAGQAGRPIPKGALRSRAPAGPYYRAIAAALRMTLTYIN